VWWQVYQAPSPGGPFFLFDTVVGALRTDSTGGGAYFYVQGVDAAFNPFTDPSNVTLVV
jgi:hypothetical protein